MSTKRTVLALAVAAGLPFLLPAFEPIVVAGADAGFVASASSAGETAATGGEVRPRLAVSWREALGDGFIAVDAQGGVSIPLDAPLSISDDESLTIRSGFPAGSSEILLTARMESSFAVRGVARTLLVPGWGLDYNIPLNENRVALQSEGRYRYAGSSPDDVLVQRLGLGYTNQESIRFSWQADLMGGYEQWPEYELVDQSGDLTGNARRDLTAEFDLSGEGLLGYFTSWSVSTAVQGRFSNATRYVVAAGEFEPDPESRLTTRLSGFLETSPVRELSLGVRGSAGNELYFSRPSRDADGGAREDALTITTMEATTYADYNPWGDLFVVASVSGGATLANDPAYPGWYAQARLGLEYSF